MRPRLNASSISTGSAPVFSRAPSHPGSVLTSLCAPPLPGSALTFSRSVATLAFHRLSPAFRRNSPALRRNFRVPSRPFSHAPPWFRVPSRPFPRSAAPLYYFATTSPLFRVPVPFHHLFTTFSCPSCAPPLSPRPIATLSHDPRPFATFPVLRRGSGLFRCSFAALYRFSRLRLAFATSSRPSRAQPPPPRPIATFSHAPRPPFAFRRYGPCTVCPRIGLPGEFSTFLSLISEV